MCHSARRNVADLILGKEMVKHLQNLKLNLNIFCQSPVVANIISLFYCACK